MWVLLLGIDLLDTIMGGNFLSSHPLNAFHAVGDLMGLPPTTINETTLTLEHVMRRLEIIENKMSTIEHTENLD